MSTTSKREGAQRPEHTADGVIGRLPGGLAETPVQRAGLDEVQDVPGRPEQHPHAAGEHARAAAIPWHEGEERGDDDGQGERRVELRRECEAERDAADGQLGPGAAGEEDDRDEEERRDDEVVQDGGTVEQDDGKGREDEPAVCGRLP